MQIDHLGQTPLYYDFAPRCLDWSTMRYRWFGVVWEERRNSNIMVKYHFEDNEKSLVQWLQKENWGILRRVTDKANDFYRSLRRHQESREWAYHSRMTFYTIYKNPWKTVKLGWYVIRSSNTYPCIVTAVERKKLSVWIHHQYICETDQDLDTFISRVNKEWDVSLQRLSDISSQ